MLSPEKIYPEIAPWVHDLYGINGGTYEVLWNNENLVLGLWESVIRITPSNHRTPEELSAEVELLDVLHRNWCAVANIIRSRQWRLYEDVTTSDWRLYVTVFSRLQWVNPQISDALGRQVMVQEWWRTMGKIHRVTSQEQLMHKNNRLIWNQEVIIEKAHELLPQEDQEILIELKRITEKLSWASADSENYWLVHTDMRPRNFAYQDGKVMHFDFDDICHHWFMYDVAVAALHETEAFMSVTERTEFLKTFLSDFLVWYSKEREISKEMTDLLIVFMKLRCIYAYIDYYKRLKIKQVDSWKEKMNIRRWYVLNFDSFIKTDDIKLFIKWLYE